MQRKIFGLLVATGMCCSFLPAHAACYFGECTPAPTVPAPSLPAPTLPTTAPAPSAPQPADDSRPSAPVWRTVATNGAWVVRTNGQLVVLMKTIDGGAHVALVKDGNTVSFVLEDPTWGLQEGAHFDGTININGEVYRGHAVALSNKMVSFPNVSQAWLHAFFAGGRAEIAVAGETWSISLDGAGQTLQKAADS